MGMGVIRKQSYWGSANRQARRFFTDDSGPGLFRATIDVLERDHPTAPHLHCIEASAMAAFGVFTEAFDRSAEVIR